MHDNMFLFVDRNEAGEKLADKLLDEPLIQKAASEELLVLSIPRGGVVVGAAIAQALQCSHDVIVVKKIGFPGQEELAIGAMAEDGTMVLNRQVTSQYNSYTKQSLERVKTYIDTAIQKYRQGRTLDIKAKIVIVVDDGIATGETMKAVIMWLTSRDPTQRPQIIVVAVPVCSPGAAADLGKLVDRLIYLSSPERFWAVGQFYWDFDPISDEQVVEYLLAQK